MRFQRENFITFHVTYSVANSKLGAKSPQLCTFDIIALVIIYEGIHKEMALITYIEEWLDLGEETPPLPVTQLEVGQAVTLDDTDSTQLLDTSLVVPVNGNTPITSTE